MRTYMMLLIKTVNPEKPPAVRHTDVEYELKRVHYFKDCVEGVADRRT